MLTERMAVQAHPETPVWAKITSALIDVNRRMPQVSVLVVIFFLFLLHPICFHFEHSCENWLNLNNSGLLVLGWGCIMSARVLTSLERVCLRVCVWQSTHDLNQLSVDNEKLSSWWGQGTHIYTVTQTKACDIWTKDKCTHIVALVVLCNVFTVVF